MADEEKLADGRYLNELRVVDLKKELEKRGLSKGGSKKDLVERLRAQVQLEALRGKATDSEDPVEVSVPEIEAGDNEFIRQWKEQRKKLFAEQQEVKRQYEVEMSQSSEEQSQSENEADSRRPEMSPPASDKVRRVRTSSKDEPASSGGDPVSPTKRSTRGQVERLAKGDAAESPPKKRRWGGRSRSGGGDGEADDKTEKNGDEKEEAVSQEPDPKMPKLTPEKDNDVVDGPKSTPEKAQERGNIFNIMAPEGLEKLPSEESKVEPEKMDVEEPTIAKDAEPESKPAPSPKRSRSSSGSSSSRSRSRSASKERTVKADKKKSRQRSRSESSSNSRSRSRSKSPPAPPKLKAKSKSSPVRAQAKSESRSRSKSPVRSKSRSPSHSRSRSASKEKEDKGGSSSNSKSRSKSRSQSRSSSESGSESSSSGSGSSSDSDAEDGKKSKKKSTKKVPVKGKVSSVPKRLGQPAEDSFHTAAEDISMDASDRPQEDKRIISTSPVKEKQVHTREEKEDQLQIKAKLESQTSQEDKPAKKRRWGITRTTKKSSINISTDSLKELVPDIKPSSIKMETVLEMEQDFKPVFEEVSQKEPEPAEEEEPMESITRTVVVKSEEEKENEPTADAAPKEENTEVTAPKIAMRRPSKTPAAVPADEPEAARRTPSPARNPVSKILHVTNLVRPFTLGQLKGVLGKVGTLVDEKFWIDKIKSHCFACFETEEQAQETRLALHGTRWPLSNPKILRVEFATEKELASFVEKGAPPPAAAPPKSKESAREIERQKRREKSEERIKARDARRKEREERDKEKARKEHVREWDRGKVTKSRSRSKGRSRDRSRPSGDRRKSSGDRDQGRASRDADKDRGRKREHSKERKEKKEKQKEEEQPAKLLDDLFRKTKATPCIYWLPLTAEQITAKQELEKKKQEARKAREEEEEKRRQERIKEREKADKLREERRKADRERERERDKGRRDGERNRSGGSRSRSRGRRRRSP